MVIRKRGLNTKRHTTSYLVGNAWRSRKEAVQLAKRGKVDGVRVGTKEGVEFITSLPGYPNLYDLPAVVR